MANLIGIVHPSKKFSPPFLVPCPLSLAPSLSAANILSPRAKVLKGLSLFRSPVKVQGEVSCKCALSAAQTTKTRLGFVSSAERPSEG
jgi:hypothetical protein